MQPVFRSVSCIEVGEGVQLRWTLRDDCKATNFSIYVTNNNRTFAIVSPILNTCSCFIKTGNDGLASSYKIYARLTDGEEVFSESVQPQRINKEAKLLLKEIRRRELVFYKSHPFGAYPFSILLKKQVGISCPLCGDNACGGVGKEGASTNCPKCLGTGVEDPYILWPEKELMLEVSPKDDKVTSPDGVQRFAVERTFKTVFNGIIREDDIIVTGNEAYVIQKQDVVSSVGNTPAIYMLQAVQLLPKDPRYPVLINMCERSVNE